MSMQYSVHRYAVIGVGMVAKPGFILVRVYKDVI